MKKFLKTNPTVLFSILYEGERFPLGFEHPVQDYVVDNPLFKNIYYLT